MFMAVMETGSFTGAAERLGVSSGQASKMVSRLETGLGVRLLSRTTRAVSPTEAGRAYFERLRPLLEEFDNLDAAVDCWGGGVSADADQLTDLHPVAPIDLTSDLAAPLLGIFSNDDRSPTPEQVDQHEAALKEHGKTYEFHRYNGAGHGFFAVNRPGYRSGTGDRGLARGLQVVRHHLAS